MGEGGLEHEYPEGAPQRLEALARVLAGCPDPLAERLLFLRGPVHVLVQDDPGPVLICSPRLPEEDGVRLLPGAVDEAPLVVEVVLDRLVFKEVLREWDDVLVAAAGEQRQVLEGIEPPVRDDQLPLEHKGAHQVLHAGLVDHASRIYPREHRLAGVDVVGHEEIDLHLLRDPVFVAVLGKVVLMRVGLDAMPVYGYLVGIVQQVLLVARQLPVPPAERVEEIGEDAVAHRDRGVPDGKAALGEELGDVLQPRVPVDHVQQGQGIYPGGVQGVKEHPQVREHRLRRLVHDGVLTVLDDGDLLLTAEVVVRDEPDPLLDAADEAAHLEAPLAVLALLVRAGVHVVPVLDRLHHGALRLESPDVLGNGIIAHGPPSSPVTYRIPNYGTGGGGSARKSCRENRGFYRGERSFRKGKGRKPDFRTRSWDGNDNLFENSQENQYLLIPSLT